MALLVSAIVAPFSAILASNIDCGFAPLALNAENVLLKNLSNLELLNSMFLPRVAAAFIPLPTPYTTGVINKDSAPNFVLFINFLNASSLPPSSVTSSKSVGPASNTSPKVPSSSTSATNASPAAPPATPATNLLLPIVLLKSSAFFAAFCKLVFLRFM